MHESYKTYGHTSSDQKKNTHPLRRIARNLLAAAAFSGTAVAVFSGPTLPKKLDIPAPASFAVPIYSEAPKTAAEQAAINAQVASDARTLAVMIENVSSPAGNGHKSNDGSDTTEKVVISPHANPDSTYNAEAFRLQYKPRTGDQGNRLDSDPLKSELVSATVETGTVPSGTVPTNDIGVLKHISTSVSYNFDIITGEPSIILPMTDDSPYRQDFVYSGSGDIQDPGAKVLPLGQEVADFASSLTRAEVAGALVQAI